jgi:hypothetical protein
VSAPPAPGAADYYALLKQEVSAHPYRSLAIAAGLGYLLGSRLGGPLVSLLGSRLGPQLASSLIAALEASKPPTP